jgi:hypothetical protein
MEMLDSQITKIWDAEMRLSPGGGVSIRDCPSIVAMREAYFRSYAARAEAEMNTLSALKNGMWLTLLVGFFLMFFLLDLLQEGFWFLG